MKYKLFPAQFFYQFMQPSPPPIVKLKYLNDVMRGQHKNGPMPLKLAPPPYDNFKISPQPTCSSKSYKYDNYDKTT